MTKYSYSPEGIGEVERFFFKAEEKQILSIVSSKKVFVLDTCFIQRLIGTGLSEVFAEYVFSKGGMILIFRTIIAELAGEKKQLSQEIKDFFVVMEAHRLNVFIAWEEETYDVLKLAYVDTALINSFLVEAVKYNLGGTWVEDQQVSEKIRNEIIEEKTVSSSMFYRECFELFRRSKSSGDDLGEEKCLVCIYVLSCLPASDTFNFLFCTEDRKSMSLLEKFRRNIYRHKGKKTVGFLSYLLLIQWQIDKKELISKDGIKKALAPYIVDGFVTAVVRFLYCDDSEKVSMDPDAFIDSLLNGEIEMRI